MDEKQADTVNRLKEFIIEHYMLEKLKDMVEKTGLFVDGVVLLCS